MIMLSAIRFGLKRSLAHFFGICFGFPIMVIVVGVGLRAVYIRYPMIHELIKYIGALYMLYLGWKIMRASTVFEKVDAGTKTMQPMRFFQAALFQWVNPKAWIMAIAAVSTYTVVNGNLYLQTALIAFVFLLASFPCVGIWFLGGKLVKRIFQNQHALRLFNLTMGVLLMLSIVLIFVE